MSEDAFIQLHTPPLPYYLGAGRSDYQAGESHPNRRHLGLYDLLLVEKGVLHIGENGQEWAVSAGEMLLLLPEGEHYATRPCDGDTTFYWVHFDHDGAVGDRRAQASGKPAEAADFGAAEMPAPSRRPFDNPYTVRIPKHARLPDLSSVIDLLNALLDPKAENDFWGEQRLFAELLAMLSDSKGEEGDSSTHKLAERTIAYLQRNYRADVTNESLAQALHFHPNYVVRCMKSRYGRTPMEYLHDYRLERAKRLLITTGWPIARIAEETGFRYAPYFTACFKRSVGLTPLRFRKQYLN